VNSTKLEGGGLAGVTSDGPETEATALVVMSTVVVRLVGVPSTDVDTTTIADEVVRIVVNVAEPWLEA